MSKDRDSFNETRSCGVHGMSMAERDDMTAAHIAKFKHQIVGVLTDPPFVYTIGVSLRYGFEFLQIGLDQGFSATMINDIVKLLDEGGTIEYGVDDPRWANLPCRFYKTTHPTVHKDYVIQADRYFDKLVEVVQIVVPDKDGRFFDHDEYDREMMEHLQPVFADGNWGQK